MAAKSAAIPRRHVTIVTCMDARVDALGAFDFAPGDAHVLRNAGAIVTDDVLRSLVLSQRLLQTRSVLIMGHTECGLRTFTDEELTNALAWETGVKPPFAFGAFHDIEEHVRTGVERVRECPWLPHVDDVRGYVYDVNDHTARLLTP
jgi:carbonic anhydrase